ncbi:uncharacterized protein [Nothobranchius furzeri]|uniref:LOC107377585-like protein n=1 Tax=Nothobranchius furzeri TaxID=105023 RepID=A0A9D2Z294_NOTFU|nr:uncharacterized protein LOC107377585 [Nothobranchius furzeri]KAF7230593.1 putative LOC107377585-like protein [Nothobranchius furzeri]
MDIHMFGRKRPLFSGHEEQLLPSCKRKCLTDWSNRALQHDGLKAYVSPTWVSRGTKYLTDTKGLFGQILFWSNTQNSAKKVLEHLRSKAAIVDTLLSDSVSRKFSTFHRDMTEECGAEAKQHSWAVLEKPEEIIMYGPYYPNYNNGEHSEDIIIKQTQELLCSRDVPEDWKVYVFTMNSPCLVRNTDPCINTDPCMLSLIHKAWEWWRVHGVKTHIGYVRCWGFKGNKENLFKEINFRQVECITQGVDYESYSKLADKITDLNPLCETVFSIAKDVLRSDKKHFPMMSSDQKQDRRSYFKSMSCSFEGKQGDEKKHLTTELNTMIEAAEALLSEKPESIEEHLEKGEAFSMAHTFSSQVCEALRDEMRVRFQQCWREMVQDRYAEFVRDELTEKFNRSTVQLFLQDVQTFTRQYLQIGKLQL